MSICTEGVLVYLDDILIYTNMIEEHTWLVCKVLQKLLHAKLFEKLSKCEFRQTELDYLGYQFSWDAVEMDPKKVRAVLEWQAPGTRKQLQSLQISIGNLFYPLLRWHYPSQAFFIPRILG